MPVIRDARTHHFVPIPTEALRNPDLSLQAKGLLAEILCSAGEIGWHDVSDHAALKELIDAGYVTDQDKEPDDGS